MKNLFSRVWHLLSGIRAKVVLLSGLLLLLPLIGYNYVWELENVLRQGQEQTLMGSARAFSMALNQQPELFERQLNTKPRLEEGKDLYALALQSPIDLDGSALDWQRYRAHTTRYRDANVLFSRTPYNHNDINFNLSLGSDGHDIYALVDVTDKKPVLQRKNAHRIDRNDHLVITLTTPEGELKRYAITATKSGKADVYLIDGDISDDTHNFLSDAIKAWWQETATGYTIEVALPAWLVGEKLSVAYYNVNDRFNRDVETIIATSNPRSAETLGTFLEPSPQIDNVLSGMADGSSVVWVVDKHGRVLAKVGDLQSANGVWETTIKYQENPDGMMGWLQMNVLNPLYYKLLERPPEEIIDEMQNAAIVRGVDVQQALLGRPYANWRITPEQGEMILSAAYPIKVHGEVIGAVVVEETTKGIKTLRNKALEQLFNVLLAVICTGVIVLLLFGSHISRRVRKLRDDAESAIDPQGRVKHQLAPISSADEIGDLSRTLSTMVTRLSDYNSYLEKMSSSLSHELRTPVAVVRSSLENLSFVTQNEDQQRYIDRAQEGVKRLATILSSMTEATRLEQSFEHAESVKYPLNKVIEGCVQGYEYAYPEQTFSLKVTEGNYNSEGVPEYIAQLLDKLVANAVEFRTPGTPIDVYLTHRKDKACITVSNSGPLLPENMGNQLLNSMVSVRHERQKSDKPHLGLGLYIARLVAEFHGGDLMISNRSNKEGVIVTVLLPLT
ncbi:proteobacterial dedicated sortase system histidine kinase [Enterovibrio nigricans]|uniref:histidine kinase n=1 Tax=Enterovibrio nigricans DSM 22720 TaxID=1121868 RepID=A0A1T4UDT9_9GAMM|nr:proteobacterial dedicated sortase system histidine kinase [Enterovibrio nigricans]PKF50739.1 proteobacterial dedicated sortase system histidine kinase [Enterovibrio nigricans]SKA50834.1 dedicated sortase system histidine kinase [Enterovibrio nigricans DSM 22720]